MSKSSVVVAVDQGTSSTKAVAIDTSGAIVAVTKVDLGHQSSRPGWVEQDPEEILNSVNTALGNLAETLEQPIAAIGISNQRESALIWDRTTGKAVAPMLGWQDRRTQAKAEELIKTGHGAIVRERSGLPVSPMFSALKWQWLLDEIDPDRTRSCRGELVLGTVDAWIRYKLTGDLCVETGNASRTQLYNVTEDKWDEELCELFQIPPEALPQVVASDHVSNPLTSSVPDLAGVRITAVLGDSHAALYGHGIRQPGEVKTTFGTGSSVMGLTDQAVPAASGMVHTIAWRSQGCTKRAFEGNMFSTGATVQWLAEVMGCTPDDLAEDATTIADTKGLSLVPAFSGLGAPWWDENAVALIVGLGLGHRRPHFARAAFESIAHQITDTLEAADKAAGQNIESVLVDGGPTKNDWLMQLQADISGRTIIRSDVKELSASGAAHLAGIAAEVWDEQSVAQMPRHRKVFTPNQEHSASTNGRQAWQDALARSRFRPDAEVNVLNKEDIQ